MRASRMYAWVQVLVVLLVGSECARAQERPWRRKDCKGDSTHKSIKICPYEDKEMLCGQKNVTLSSGVELFTAFEQNYIFQTYPETSLRLDLAGTSGCVDQFTPENSSKGCNYRGGCHTCFCRKEDNPFEGGPQSPKKC